MNTKYKILIIRLSDAIQQKTYEVMLENLEKEEDTGHILNLILSAHLSSCFSLMRMFSAEHKEMLSLVEKFIMEIENFLLTREIITEIETIKKN